MSLFYLLPPRPLLADRLGDFLKTYYPGLDWSSVRDELAETVLTLASLHPDVYVVFREDLADGADPSQALTDAFGAEPGDEVIEMRPGARPGELTARRWRLSA